MAEQESALVVLPHVWIQLSELTGPLTTLCRSRYGGSSTSAYLKALTLM